MERKEEEDDENGNAYTGGSGKKRRRAVTSDTSGGMREYQSITERADFVKLEAVAPVKLFSPEDFPNIFDHHVLVVVNPHETEQWNAFAFSVFHVCQVHSGEAREVTGVEMYRSNATHGIHAFFFAVQSGKLAELSGDFRYHDVTQQSTKSYSEDFCLSYKGVTIRVSAVGETVWHGCRLLTEIKELCMPVKVCDNAARHPKTGHLALIVKMVDGEGELWWRRVRDVQAGAKLDEIKVLLDKEGWVPLRRVLACCPETEVDEDVNKQVEKVVGATLDYAEPDETPVDSHSVLAITDHLWDSPGGVRLNTQDKVTVRAQLSKRGIDVGSDLELKSHP